MKLREQVPIAPMTTLELGGPAEYFLEIRGTETLCDALAWAREQSAAVEILGGGSNVVVADRGVHGLVLRIRSSRIKREGTLVRAEAGVVWDHLVAWTVRHNLAGLECLSGIPGDVGAAPMQNVGAYGQEVSDCIEWVRCLRRSDGVEVTFDRDACRFGYRDSIFKGEAAGVFVVLEVAFRLRLGGVPTVSYPDLERAVGPSPTLAEVREQVVVLRRLKSMVLDAHDANRRSAGSFFVNPTLSAEDFAEVEHRGARLAPDISMPRYPLADGRVKVPAAWLIERSGWSKGTRRGRVGLSSKHTLALVNHGEATASELVAFAGEIRDRVRETFGVPLVPEPRFLGFEPGELARIRD